LLASFDYAEDYWEHDNISEAPQDERRGRQPPLRHLAAAGKR